MIARNCDGKLPAPGAFSRADKALHGAADAIVAENRDHHDVQAIHKALDAIWKVVADANRYFAGEEPWALKKTDPERMGTVLYVTAEVLRELAILTQPYIPAAAAKLLDLLGVPADRRNFAALGSGRPHRARNGASAAGTGLSALRGRGNRAGGFVMPLAIVDSHCHLDFEQFAGKIDEIIARARDNGVLLMVTISTRVKRFDQIRAIAEAHRGNLVHHRHPSPQRQGGNRRHRR